MTTPDPKNDRPELIRFLARDQLSQRVQQPAPRAEVTLVGGDVPVIRIYDVIDSWGGYWGVSSMEVAEALDLVPDGTPVVEVHLNSPGGEATEGVAIANLFRQHPAKVVAVVDGLAASAASMIAMGADEVVMAPSSQMMIHDASGGAWGTAAFLEKQARALHHLSDMYAAAYAGKAGGTPAAWRVLMLAETWYSPEEAVEAGLADRVLEAKTTDDPQAAVARHDLRVFAYAGRQQAPTPGSGHPRAASDGVTFAVGDRVAVTIDPPHMPGQTTGTVAEVGGLAYGVVFDDMPEMGVHRWYVAAEIEPAAVDDAEPAMRAAPKSPATPSASGSTNTAQEAPMSLSDAVRERLGIADENANEDTILAALDEALQEQVTPPTAQIPEGHVVVPAAKLADLEAGANAGTAAARKLAEQERDTFLDSVRTKYAPANRAAWAAEYDRDPVGTRAHFENAPEIVAVTSIGHDEDRDTTADDAVFAALFGAETKVS